MIALSPKAAAVPWLLAGWALAWAAAMAVPGSPATSLPVQLAICLPLAAIFGLPHGATDWWLAAERLPPLLGKPQRRYWPLWFGAIYLLGMLAAVALIVAWPTLALLLFIAGSVWHWGVFDARAHHLGNSPAAWLACALPPIAAPLAFRPGDSAQLLHALGVAVTPAQICLGGGMGLALAAAAALRLRPPRALMWEMLALLAMCAVAPPLAAFAAYFCLVHAPRQAAALQVSGRTSSVLLVSAAAALLIAVPLLIAARSGVLAPSQAAIRVVFWGLAVLTVPHALCGWLLAAPTDVSNAIESPKGLSV